MSDFPEILTTSRFYLELKLEGSNDSIDGYFMECSGFKSSQAVIEVSHVTPQKWGSSGAGMGRIVSTKIPGNQTHTNLTLRRGLTCSMTLWDWLQSVQEGNWAKQRAWPVGYMISDVAASKGDLEVEEMEVAVEELKRIKVAE